MSDGESGFSEPSVLYEWLRQLKEVGILEARRGEHCVGSWC